MSTNQQALALMARWEAERLEHEQQKADRRRAKIEGYRAQMLAGTWKPNCRCAQCVEAILDVNVPAGLCQRALSTWRWWD